LPSLGQMDALMGNSRCRQHQGIGAGGLFGQMTEQIVHGNHALTLGRDSGRMLLHTGSGAGPHLAARRLTDGLFGLGFVLYHLTLFAPAAGLSLAKDVFADIPVILESRIPWAFDELIVQSETFLDARNHPAPGHRPARIHPHR
jgi:hypothetical protein